MSVIADQALREQRALSSKRHFEVMDGLRGVAAMAVVLLHSFMGGGLAVNGQLAVDLFFLLSGFVIGYAYDEKLRTNMSAMDFIAKRVIRLYPMVLVGAVGGIVIALIHNKTNPGDAYPLSAIATSGGLSLFVLPYLGPDISNKAFSFNPPLWSLAFELAANFFYVLFAKRLHNVVLAVIVVLGLVGIVMGGPLGGGSKETILLGFPRVACGFFGGLLLYRLWRAGKLPEINGNFFALAAVISAVFLIPKLIGGWAFLPVYLLFVGVIICAAGARPSASDKYCALLGEVSYPLYLVHWLTLYVFTWVGAKVGLAGEPWKYSVVAAAHWLLAPVVAYLFARFYDRPVRKALMAWWGGVQRGRVSSPAAA